jgi:hypothetical protein
VDRVDVHLAHHFPARLDLLIGNGQLRHSESVEMVNDFVILAISRLEQLELTVERTMLLVEDEPPDLVNL